MFATLIIILICVSHALVADDSPKKIEQWIEGELPSIAKLYVDLHRHPELSLQEKETSEKLAAEFRAAGFEVTTGVGGYGVVGLLKNGEGPCVMLRCDMDALPVKEETGLEYASQVQVPTADGSTTGVMHACGHDLHMAMLVGAARYLASHRDQWHGTLLLIGQPAEEKGLGAKAMLADGLFTRFPKPDVGLAIHVASELATGTVGYCPGPAMANSDSIDITMHGRGGHGSTPELTIDPIVQAAELVLALQTIISREIAPQSPAVITVGAIHGGTKHNIIGNECQLQLTVRSYSDEVREQLLEAIRRKADAVAAGARAPAPTITIINSTPFLRNDEKLTARIADLFRNSIGPGNVIEIPPRLGAEDFGRYGREGVPILMYRVGTTSRRRLDQFTAAGQSPPSLHSSKYYPDFEESLQTGIFTLTTAVLDLMKP
ncbi:amidohydrolase [Planctomicrobium sp. SH661]|uniref:amidohydrolase n=1 Tax=Planctomicrobium sp. SH661 TaxID=3448124 RepID=UPI003F5BAD69